MKVTPGRFQLPGVAPEHDQGFKEPYMSEHAEIVRFRREIEALRAKYEPEIVRLIGVAPLGADRVQEWGYTADGRWVSRIVSVTAAA